jgi:hypothetical protein
MLGAGVVISTKTREIVRDRRRNIMAKTYEGVAIFG